MFGRALSFRSCRSCRRPPQRPLACCHTVASAAGDRRTAAPPSAVAAAAARCRCPLPRRCRCRCPPAANVRTLRTAERCAIRDVCAGSWAWVECSMAHPKFQSVTRKAGKRPLLILAFAGRVHLIMMQSGQRTCKRATRLRCEPGLLWAAWHTAARAALAVKW